MAQNIMAFHKATGELMAENATDPDRWETIRSRELSPLEVAEIRDSLKGLRFGCVQIIVQDGVIVQVDRTEKRRLR
jgi:hypothetical protein